MFPAFVLLDIFLLTKIKVMCEIKYKNFMLAICKSILLLEFILLDLIKEGYFFQYFSSHLIHIVI